MTLGIEKNRKNRSFFFFFVCKKVSESFFNVSLLFLFVILLFFKRLCGSRFQKFFFGEWVFEMSGCAYSSYRSASLSVLLFSYFWVDESLWPWLLQCGSLRQRREKSRIFFKMQKVYVTFSRYLTCPYCFVNIVDMAFVLWSDGWNSFTEGDANVSRWTLCGSIGQNSLASC